MLSVIVRILPTLPLFSAFNRLTFFAVSSHPALNRAQKTADNNKMMKLPIIKSAGKGLLPYFPEVIDIAIDFSSGLPMIQVILDDQ